MMLPATNRQLRSAAPRRAAADPRSWLRRARLRHILFLLFFLSGIVPLIISSLRLIAVNRDILKTQETVLLTSVAQALADDLSDDLARRREQLRQLGTGLLAQPSDADLQARLREPWVVDYLRRFLDYNPKIVALSVVDRQGSGPRFGSRELHPQVQQAMLDAFAQVREERVGVYRFVVFTASEPGVVITVPVDDPASDAPESGLVMQGVVDVALNLPVIRTDLAGLEDDTEELFLVGADGGLLWSQGDRPEIEAALMDTDLVLGLGRGLSSITREYDLAVGDRVVPTLARLVPVAETGWGVIAHKPVRAAYREVRRMVVSTLQSSVALVAVALVLALWVARSLSRPLQRLTETSHEIASGHFDRRVDTKGLAFELGDLADDFNQMGNYVENYIARLRKAAEINRELFISSIRAFAAAIDAKDPYTRGHSERVAAYSRAIARYMGLSEEMQDRIWVSAVLHDVGKIGVEDRILLKKGRLTDEEFAQMKLHTVIGAEICMPIEQLREMIPGIRSHHEAWNGTGYPDGLKGETIPLTARVIGVADTFDAMTTTRPYQEARTAEFTLETIKKLTGTKFDARIVTAFLLAYDAGHIERAREQAEIRSANLRTHITDPLPRGDGPGAASQDALADALA
ncbi:MAG: HD domain-containing phosphohydrolase [Acidobacteriota bacterium]